MKFHEILRQRRLALGLTQEQLAQRLGVSAPAVNKWEREQLLSGYHPAAPAGPSA